MADDRIEALVRYLRRAAEPADSPGVADSELLERFASAGDEAAFELLARRHGPMVLGVCRRVLGDSHDAEDAFQATFLVLARKASSVARQRSAGGWLYTVALRAALRARARRAARTARERPLEDLPPGAEADPAGEAAWREVRAAIDEEVSRLPEKYRVPFVLFHLEGRSSAEVAREMGRPVGTVQCWMTRARARLRAGLARRGLRPAPGMLALLAPRGEWLSRSSVRAALAAGRGAASAKAASLAGEVVRALGSGRAKLVVLLLALTTAAGACLAAVVMPRGGPPARPDAARAETTPPADRALPAVELHAPVNPHQASINALALSPDGKTLASAGDDGQVRLWDVASGLEAGVFCRSGDRSASGGRPEAHEWSAHAVAFSPDGKAVASGGGDRIVRLWDARTGNETVALRVGTFVYSVAFSPDGKALAWAGGIQPANLDTTIRWSFRDLPRDPAFYKEFGELKVWDLAARKERTFYRGDTGRVTSVCFSPDGKTLASGGRDGTVRLWDLSTGRQRACPREGAEGVRAVAFSPDGKTLAWAPGSSSGGVTLWDVAAGRVRARPRGHAGWVTALAFGPDGRTLASACSFPSPRDPRQAQARSGEVRLWDAFRGRPVGGPLAVRHGVDCLAWGARGQVLAAGGPAGTSGGGRITLWRVGKVP